MNNRTVRVLEPGFFTTVQDRGRLGYRRFGMPSSGAMDMRALDYSNVLLGNEPGSAGLEATLLGPVLEFLEDTWFSVTGDDCEPTLDGKRVPSWHACLGRKGSVLRTGSSGRGARLYIAFGGGVDTPLVMGSRSTYVAARTGGYLGRALRAGDCLPLGEQRLPPGAIKGDLVVPLPEAWQPPSYADLLPLRVVLGPQADRFTSEAICALSSSEYIVTNDSDRMGYRLSGETLKHTSGADIVSDGTVVGSIQVPGHGQPIVLMADCQTTGGYTKIGCVISTDLPLLAQTLPGRAVRFRAVTVDEAISARRQYALNLHSLQAALANQSITRAQNAKHYILTVSGKAHKITVEPI